MCAFDAAARKVWGGQAVAYATSFAAVCAYPVEELLDAAAVRAGVRLLDAGTGSGNVAAAACARDARVAAVDAAPDMVRLAADAAPRADVAVAALPSLPFADAVFDVVTANFVLDHVGWPRRCAAELARVARPGGRIALTLWPVPAGAGHALLGRATRAAGVSRPAHRPVLPPETDFPRTEQGVTELLRAAGLATSSCRTISWSHRTTTQEWWRWAEAGVGFNGHLIATQPAETRVAIRRQFELLAARFTDPDGRIALPHQALLATATVPDRPV
ncbi:class I SAM-dependent methyltransferase [Actinocatenispora thailandica]|nr:class I SAM-dependent methyltransferase [Actinocatenispora thailandica]